MDGHSQKEGGDDVSLTISDLEQRYGGKEILRGISFDVEKGKVVSVLGPNGCGKSTLIKTVCNIMKPYAGTVCADGRNIAETDPKEFSKIVGYVPQKYIPSDYMSVLDAILIGRAPYVSWSYSDDDFRAAFEAMEAIGILDLMDRSVNDLSGGQIQKVVIARALTQNPKYFVLDEPTSALDLKNQMGALRTVRDVVEKGETGALVALHDLNLAMHFCDEVVMLKDGRIYRKGSPEDTIDEDSIREVYGVSSEIVEGRSGLYVHIVEDPPDFGE